MGQADNLLGDGFISEEATRLKRRGGMECVVNVR